MVKPKITEWCDVRYLHIAWECPEGCSAEKEIIDCGNVSHDEKICLYCDYCGYEEVFKLKLKLKKV